MMICVALGLILGSTCFSWGAYNQWTSNGPYGGGIRAIAIDPVTPTTLYVGVELGGIYKSTDGAANWQKLDLGQAGTFATIETISVDPVNPHNLYASVYGAGIFKSTDGGDSWDLLNAGLSETVIHGIVVDPVNPDILYAATFYGGVFKSIDGGNNWSQSNAGLPSLSIPCIVQKSGNPDVLFAGVWGEGIYRSVDGGESWTPANAGLTNLDVIALVPDPATPETIYAGAINGGIYKSINGGEEWVLVKAGKVRSLALVPANPSLMYAGLDTNWTDEGISLNDGGIYQSSDGGQSWQRIFESAAYIAALAVDPVSPMIVYSGTSFLFGDGPGIYKSTDQGGTWQPVNNGLSGIQVEALASASDTSFIYAGAISGAFRSSDNGGTWQSISDGLPVIPIKKIVIDPLDSLILYATSTAAGTHRVYKSTDGGVTWVPIDSGLPDGSVTSIQIDPDDSAILYAWTVEGAVYKSLNAGEIWSASNGGLPTGQWGNLEIDPITPSIIYATTSDQGIYKSSDGGGNWNSINNGLTDLYTSSIAVDPANPSILYAGTMAGVFKSIDSGGSWTPINSGLTETLVEVVTIDPASPSTLYAGTWQSGIFKSTNGGSTWKPLPLGPTSRFSVNSIILDPVDPSIIFAGVGEMLFRTDSKGVFRLDQAPEITPNPASLDFGETVVASSGNRAVTLENSGFQPLQVRSIGITGTGGSAFTIVPGGPQPCATLTPLIPEGESCTVEVTYSPSATGTQSANLQIDSDAVNTPILELPLSGTGILPVNSLTVAIVGKGVVNNISISPDFNCAESSCTESFDQGSTFTLQATPSFYYEFVGWSGGGCTGLSDCSFTLDADTSITATFDTIPLVRVTGNSAKFLSLQEAYAAASAGSTLSVRNISFSEDFDLGQPVSVILQGGLEDDFSTVNGYTVLQGTLTIGSGSLVVDRVSIH